jgi:hypothetical protein
LPEAPVAENRTQWLLGAVVLLAAIRFGLVPWVESQAEQRDRLQMLTQRLDRSEGVVANREAIVAARERLAKEAEGYRERFSRFATTDEFRLVTQQRFTGLMQANGANVRVFDWVLDGDVPDSGLSYGRARVTLEGPFRDVVRAHAELEAVMRAGAIREFTVTARAPSPEPGDTLVEGLMLVDLYYRKVAP